MLDLAKKMLSARTGQTHIFSVGQAGYIIKSSSGQLLAIDLYLSECVERVEGNKGFKRLLPRILEPAAVRFDAVICTHPHLDHFDVDSVPEMMGGGTKLLCSAGCVRLVKQLRLEYYKSDIIYVSPGSYETVGDFDIMFVNCDHGTGAPDAVGVVVEVDGKTIYETGDTCLRTDSLDEVEKPLDVLIAPINGAYGNLDEEECAVLAELLAPGVTIPCHYGMFAAHHGDVGRFYDIMTERELPFLLMGQGEQYTL